ncbi:hypothetical protein PS943_01338 [Pseudomonas fluorescens]|uniref:Uncharacterized protein n=1 Tax=Pseudomonas fluorescens TaxID=294 RepID=A0A5E7W343_PSEFL|nr:hypothetical protein PS943_01338 [Pseudomonas fluorescens]
MVMLDHYKTNPLSRYLDVVCVVGFKTAKKPLARAHWIKSPNTLQTFAHSLNSNGYKIVQVALLSQDQNDWGILIGCDGHILRSNYHPGMASIESLICGSLFGFTVEYRHPPQMRMKGCLSVLLFLRIHLQGEASETLHPR